MAQLNIRRGTVAHRSAAPLVVGLLLLSIAVPSLAPPIDWFDTYRYSLEINRDAKLCRHMHRVYNSAFRQPWDFRECSAMEAVSRFDYVEPDPSLEPDLSFSKCPSTPEFAKVRWKEGRGYFENRQRDARPILAAQFDIDNDGVEDLVIKHGFILAVCGGGGGCPGGEDHIAVLRPGAVDLDKPIDRGFVIKQYVGTSPKGSALSYDTLRYQEGEAPEGSKTGDRMSARIIRPFIFDSRAYLSVYDAWAVDDPKRRRELMWVLDYQGGGSNPVTRDWQPARTTTICRYRMIPTSTKR